jgi:hypothetical protein
MKKRTAQQASDHEALPCPKRGCDGALAAFYNLTTLAPYPWRTVGFNKLTIRDAKVKIYAVNWEDVEPFCPKCGWHSDHEEGTKMQIIVRLTRALVNRGASPSDVQTLVGNAVSTVDVLAATYPRETD